MPNLILLGTLVAMVVKQQTDMKKHQEKLVDSKASLAKKLEEQARQDAEDKKRLEADLERKQLNILFPL